MLSVIIVNYNTSKKVLKLISSIKENPPKDEYEIIVVDNNSREEEKALLKSAEATVIFSEENGGFSKANNQGFEKTKGDFILFLNPDTLMLENTLDRCLDFLKSNSDVGAVGCRVVLNNGTLDMACKRSLPTLANSLGHYLGLNGKIKRFSGYRRLDIKDDEIAPVTCLVGAFMMMPREVFVTAGMFCTDYFMYGEDVDLCYNINFLGYKMYYLGDCSIVHEKGASSKNNTLVRNAFYDSMKIYYNKHKKNNKFDFLVNMGIDLARKLNL